ncbi:hypothetical protein V7798_12665 [Rhizobium laguerreae]
MTAGVGEGDRVVVEGFQRAAIGEEVKVTAVTIDNETGELVAVAEADRPSAERPAEVSVRLPDAVTR